MRHKVNFRKLSRSSSHRRALLRNMSTALINEERIVTTLHKAKELRPVVEKLVTLGRRDSVHARRQAFAWLRSETVVKKLFTDLAERYSDTPGGYTRIVRIGRRRGDCAEMAVIEFTTHSKVLLPEAELEEASAE